MLRWLVAFVVLVISGWTPTPPAHATTTTASAATFTYDATSVLCVDVHEIEGAVACPALLNDLREGSGAPAVSVRAPATTFPGSLNATNTVDDFAREPFLPDSYYDAKLDQRAPVNNAPYSTYERFDEAGNLKQVTTYDQYGDRVRQYDIGPGTRHGEGVHEFDYDQINPRQEGRWGLSGILCKRRDLNALDLWSGARKDHVHVEQQRTRFAAAGGSGGVAG